MRFVGYGGLLPTVAAAGALVMSLALAAGPAQAQDKTYVMKITHADHQR